MRYIPHGPTNKQLAGLSLQHIGEVFYGGAAGGGKSDWLLMEALAYADVPGYSGILFRESYANLSHEPDGLMPRMAEWLNPTDARWSAGTRTWHFPSGATITFGYLYKPDDHRRYAGPSYQFIGYDEVTEIRAQSYQFMFSRLRRLSNTNLPLRVRTASNPGGRSHAFFRDRFSLDRTDRHRNRNRAYIPARITDNPYLDEASYMESLAELAPVDRERLMHGDWKAQEAGTLFQGQWLPVVDDWPSEKAHKVCRYWDFASTKPSAQNPDPDYTVGTKLAEHKGQFWVPDVVRLRDTPGQVEAAVARTARADGVDCHVVIEQEPGASGVQTIDHYRRNVLPGYTVIADRATGLKTTRAAPVSSTAEAGNLYLVRGRWNDAFIDELVLFTGEQSGHDDQVDTLSGAHGYLAKHWRMTGDLMV